MYDFIKLNYLALIHKEHWDYIDLKSHKYKLEGLKKFSEQKINCLQEAFTKNEEKSSSYIDRVIVKVIDNIRICLK